MKKIKKLFLTTVILLTTAAVCFAEKTVVKNLYSYKLDNGLELYVMENHAVPLAYIEIAVKAGGRAQTKDNAGLFHLYEHMMFKGNTMYPNAAAVQRAINDMGVANWNGSTDIEQVNYFFTVPSNLLYKGLEFWNYAIREPLMNEDELEREKKVVLSEVEGNVSDQSRILYDAEDSLLFPEAPWRLDPSGAGATVRNATVADLKKIQQTYYIPNNTALFVGGDVTADDVYAEVKELYGSWKKGADPWAKENPEQTLNPFTKVAYRVMPFDRCSPQIAQITVSYRGPDTAYDRNATYAADTFGYLSLDPNGLYKKTMVDKKKLGIPNTDYIWENYLTRRESSVVEFGAVVLSPDKMLPQRAKLFVQTLQNDVVKKIISNNKIYSDEQFKTVQQSVSDNTIIDAETASGFLRSLRFWWIADSADYYFKYQENMKKTGWKDITMFLNTYVTKSYPLVTVLVNPQVYESQKAAFAEAGFTEITADNAFWWKDTEMKGDKE